MTKQSLGACLALAAVSFLLSPEKTAAESKPIRFLVSNGMKAAIEELQPQCEHVVGSPLALQFSSTFGLKKRINAGEAFDATIITSEAVAELTKHGKLASGSSAYLGRSPLGIGIRTGASKPDISTPAAFKQALLNAKSITYPQDGATRGFIDNMFVQMGIDAQVKPKIILAPSSGASTENVATGKAEFVITLFSEIVPVHGIEVLGPLPGEYRTYVNFTVAASSTAQNADAVKRLIALLASPKTAPLLKAKGLEIR